MSITFPSSPTDNQVYQSSGVYYRWSGVKWKRSSDHFQSVVTEYTDSATQLDIDPTRYNYYNIDLNVDVQINIPVSPPYNKIIMDITQPGYPGWVLDSASYDNVSFSVTSQDGNPFGIFFKPDGTKMYMVGLSSRTVYQYSLSTAWDITTASYDNAVWFSVAAQDTSPYGIFFKPDGTKMYMVGASSGTVYQYTLSTAWDLNTASYNAVSFSVTSQDTSSTGIFFKPDGTKMYMVGRTSDRVYQYSLSTAWDLNTASYDNAVSFSVRSQDTSPYGIFFKPDGTKMYMVGNTSRTVYQYTLSTAWDLNTASYDNAVWFSVAAQDTNPTGIFFKPDGTKMYMVGRTSDTVHQYTTIDASGTLPTITWSDNILWDSGNPPTVSFDYAGTSLIEFVTIDGRTWSGSPILIDGRT